MSLFIAAKLEDNSANLNLKQLLSYVAETNTMETLLEAEREVLKVKIILLCFNLFLALEMENYKADC